MTGNASSPDLTTTPVALGLLAALVLTGCDSEAPAVDTSTVSDSAGIEIVTNPPATEVGQLVLREDLRLGVFDAEGPEQFAGVFTVDINEQGHIFVGNDATASVRVFDRDGEFVTELGGRGDGPGEVSMVNDLLVAGDTVGIVDWQRGGKIPFYSLDGSLLRTLSLRQEDGSRFIPLHRAPDGWYVSVSAGGRPPALAPGDSTVVTQDVLITGLENPDLEAAPHYSLPVYTLYGTTGSGEGAVDWGLFRAQMAWGFDARGRFYVTQPGSYRIDVHDATGLIRSIRREWNPRRIGPDDVEALKAATAQAYDTMSRVNDDSRAAQRERSIERIDRQGDLPLPEVMTPLTGMLVSSDGSFWVEVADPEALVRNEVERSFGGFGGVSSRESVWELYDPRGLLLGRVTLPPRFRPEAVSGQEVVGVWLDDLDVEYVLRYAAEPVR